MEEKKLYLETERRTIMLTEYSFDLVDAPSLEIAELRQLSFELQGFRYKAAPPEDTDTNEVLFLPKADSPVYRNSFVPEIRIREERSDDGTRYHVGCRLSRPVRLILLVIFLLLCGFQILELAFLFAGKMTVSFSLFIPVIIALFAFLMTQTANAVIKKRLPDILRDALSLRQ